MTAEVRRDVKNTNGACSSVLVSAGLYYAQINFSFIATINPCIAGSVSVIGCLADMSWLWSTCFAWG